MAHRWLALGRAAMNGPEATRWSTAEPWRVVEAPLEVRFRLVRCASCLEPPETAPVTCPGPPVADDAGHLWEAEFTAALSDVQARAWVDDATFPPVYPQVVAVLCLLCGCSADEASAVCPERSTDPRDGTASDAL